MKRNLCPVPGFLASLPDVAADTVSCDADSQEYFLHVNCKCVLSVLALRTMGGTSRTGNAESR